MNSKELEVIFKYQLKKDARTVSVATLLSNRYLKRIMYNPYYQRNYVWERIRRVFHRKYFLRNRDTANSVFKKVLK